MYISALAAHLPDRARPAFGVLWTQKKHRQSAKRMRARGCVWQAVPEMYPVVKEIRRGKDVVLWAFGAADTSGDGLICRREFKYLLEYAAPPPPTPTPLPQLGSLAPIMLQRAAATGV